MRKLDDRAGVTVLMLVAIVALAGFLVWLYMASRQAPEVEPAPAGTPAAQPNYVGLHELEGPPGEIVGRVAQVPDAYVQRSLGRGVFLIEVDSVATYPVLLGPDLISRDIMPEVGDRVSVLGRIYTLNDSIRSEWVKQGAVESVAGISASTSFLLADSARVTR